MSLINRASLYWHTLRFLRPVQFHGRLRFRLVQPQLDTAPAPAIAVLGAGCWVSPARRRSSMCGPGVFRFLNEVGALVDLGWDNPACEKLWRYNQHYFDDLNSDGASERRLWHLELLTDWVRKNSPAQGTGWEPYPTSLRIVNWLKWQLAANELPVECVQSLAVQVRWLSKRLEWHLLGNHLFANAKALVFAGLAFKGKEAEEWLQTGLRLIHRELPEQVLSDGANFELSTMYHAIFLEDVLDLINAANTWPGRIDAQLTRQLQHAAERLIAWLQGMIHPDGEIALFNDAALGIAPSPSQLMEYAGRLGFMPADIVYRKDQTLRLHVWRKSGYIRMQSQDALAFLDVARIGPDYLPGHGHADTLSFELSLFDQRVIVNGGTSRYGLGSERLRERQTLSHSTVEVDGQSSSEVWGGFRVARRAYPFDLSVSESSSDSVAVGCSHDGYKRLPGRPVHRREWRMRQGELEVRDSVSGRYGRAIARYIIHPDVGVSRIAEDTYKLSLPAGGCVIVEIKAGQGKLEPAQYAPEFGRVFSTQCIAVVLRDGKSHVNLKWS